MESHWESRRSCGDPREKEGAGNKKERWQKKIRKITENQNQEIKVKDQEKMTADI